MKDTDPSSLRAGRRAGKRYRYTVHAIDSKPWPYPWSGGPIFNYKQEAVDHIVLLDQSTTYVIVQHTSQNVSY